MNRSLKSLLIIGVILTSPISAQQCSMYVATTPYQSVFGMDDYCNTMCLGTSFCPETHCRCADTIELTWTAISTCPYAGVTSYWCQTVCAVNSGACPTSCCEQIQATASPPPTTWVVLDTCPYPGVTNTWCQNNCNNIIDCPAACCLELGVTPSPTSQPSESVSSQPSASTTPSAPPAGDPYAVGWGHSFNVFDNGQVWGWGLNAFGGLGVDTSGADLAFPVQITSLENLEGGDIMQIAGGDAHSLVLMRNGSVYTVGLNSLGQLGLPAGLPLSSATPTLVQSISDIVHIAAGQFISFAVTSSGDVWGWGFGDTGLLTGNPTAPDPVQLNGLTNIVQISSFTHAAAVDTNGAVWVWGPNSVNQAGPGSGFQSTPHQMTGLSSIVMVAAGVYSSHALDANGDIFSWGQNSVGQFGTGVGTVGQSSDSPIQANDVGQTFVSICSGLENVMALTDAGDVYGAGYNTNNQILSSTTNAVTTFTESPELSSVTVAHLRCGDFHVMVVDDADQVYTVGLDQNERLGNGVGQQDSATLYTVLFGGP